MRVRALLSHATPAITMALVVLASCSLDPKPAPAPPSSAVETAPSPPPPPPVTTVPMQAFESPTRDPFAGPSLATVVTPPAKDEVPRKAKKYSLDQLKLVGIVTGDEQRAMLVDPRGKGWIVSRGDHVGRADVVADRFAGWRVHRIKAEEIVFVRDDGDTTEAETRVLALHAAAQTDVDD